MRLQKLRMAFYALLILVGFFAAVPSFLPNSISGGLPQWYSQNQFSLGLDLKGGAHLLLEINAQELMDAKLKHVASSVEQQLIDENLLVKKIKIEDEKVIVLNKVKNSYAVKAAVKKVIADLDLQGDITLLTNPGTFELLLKKSFVEEVIDDALQNSLDIVRHRLNESGMASPLVNKQGDRHIVVQLPGVEDPARVVNLLGKTAKMTFHWLASPSYQGDVQLLEAMKSEERYSVQDRVALHGRHISGAHMAFHPNTNEPIVNFKLDKDGAKIFGDITTKNVGKPLAIVLDDKVVTAPVIQTAILGGSGQISGDFTSDEAHDLALLLRAGALPASLDIVEERTVGPSLGSDSIERGFYSGLFGIALIFAFMFMCYGRWGGIACLGLLVNAVLIFGVLAILGATLTLPGIAGLILCLGMAVDANILINERIREEFLVHQRAYDAVQNGLSKAYKTIIDSSVTTLIAVCLLYLLGSGPVRGFALTMGIGLMTSVFTAVTINKMLMLRWLKVKGFDANTLSGYLHKLRFDEIKYDFVGNPLIGLILAILLVSISLLCLSFMGLNMGIDFVGGGLLELTTKYDLSHLRLIVSDIVSVPFSVQEIDSAKSYIVRLAQSGVNGQDTMLMIEDIKNALLSADPNVEVLRSEMVGAGVSQDFIDRSGVALLCATFGVLVYLWVRFERHFALSAIASVVVDVLLTLGFFVFIDLEFNLASVAALLALIGYSVNDKVVLFDRVRETLAEDESADLKSIIGHSISRVLSRTLWTSISTLLALIPMAIIGGETLQNFIWPIIFGVVVGTISTIFFAAAMLYYLCERRKSLGIPQLHVDNDEQIQAMP